MLIEARIKKGFLRAIKRGEISCNAVAEYLKVDRITVYRWCKARRIDPVRCRQLAEARTISRIMDTDRKPTKRVQREDAADALDTWNWKHGAPGLEQGETAERH